MTASARVYTNGQACEPPPLTSDDKKFFLQEGADDEGNAQCVYRMFGRDFLYCAAYGWMRWTGTHWQADGTVDAALNRAITDTLTQRRVVAVEANREDIVKGTKRTATRIRGALYQLEAMCTAHVSEFDSNPDLLNCRNGVVDLRTGKIEPHDPSQRFTYYVDTEYHKDTDQTVWRNYLKSVVKDYDQPDVADWLQMAAGYTITGHTREECLFYIHGPTRSGKGTFTNALLGLLGGTLSKGVSFSMFTKQRDGDSQNFDLAPLKPCRFIAASESGKYQAMNEAVVKQITGNDQIQASFKHKTPFSFHPQFKIWLSSNHPVKGDVDDDAFWGRVRVIEFPNSYLGKEDKSIKELMQTDAYRQAILAWAVEGAIMWSNEPFGLVTPDTITASTAGQRAEQDTVQQWLDECTVTDPDETTTNHQIYDSYGNWCEEDGHTAKKAASLGRALGGKGYESCKIKAGFTVVRGRRNLRIVSDC